MNNLSEETLLRARAAMVTAIVELERVHLEMIPFESSTLGDGKLDRIFRGEQRHVRICGLVPRHVEATIERCQEHLKCIDELVESMRGER